jgi:hypothetical protein
MQRKMNRIGFALVGLALGLAARSARADGVVASPLSLPNEVRLSLEKQIAQARAADPQIFAAVAAVDTYKPEGARRNRHGQPMAARAFMLMGPRALLPLIEWAAFKAPARGNLGEAEWRALGSGLLQAIGVLKDPRGAPVLRAVFAGASDPEWLEQAAMGLGMMCGEAERQLLIAETAPASGRRDAAVAGLGYCRTPETAQKLGELMAQATEPALAARVGRALGYVGSSWALAAEMKQGDKRHAGRLAPEQADAIQRTAAEALVAALPRHAGETREAIGRGVLMVEHPIALDRLEAASRTAPAALRADLERLRGQLAASLARAKK